MVPNMIIYVRADPKICMERINARNRAEEMGRIDLEYLSMLHDCHERWLNPANEAMRSGQWNVIILDGNIPQPQIEPAYENLFRIIERKLQTENQATGKVLIDNSLGIIVLSPDAYVPQRATFKSIGYDLYSPKTIVLPPHSRQCVLVDIAITLPQGTYGRIAPRSGLALKGIDIAGGVIDPDFTGNIGVIMVNQGPAEFQGTIIFCNL